MALIIPNATDTTGGNKYAALDQAEPDALDFEILGTGSGVFSGCAVTSTGSSSTVAVAAGVISLKGVPYAVSANAALSLPSAPADNRFDLVVARVASGTASLVVISGTNSSTNPSFPKSVSVLTGAPSPTTNFYPDTDVLLAALYRTGASTVTTSRIVDKRVQVTSSIISQGTGDPTPSSAGTGGLYYKTAAPTGSSSGVFVQTSTGAWVELAQNTGPTVPIGGAILWPSKQAVPTNYVEANGQTLATATYPTLFAAYQYDHGGSGGSFLVPNYNNKFVRGTTSTSLVGTTVGADTVTLSEANLASHKHVVDPPSTGLSATGGSVFSDIPGPPGTHTVSLNPSYPSGGNAILSATSVNGSVNISAFDSSTTGSGTPFNIIPASAYARWIIRAL